MNHLFYNNCLPFAFSVPMQSFCGFHFELTSELEECQPRTAVVQSEHSMSRVQAFETMDMHKFSSYYLFYYLLLAALRILRLVFAQIKPRSSLVQSQSEHSMSRAQVEGSRKTGSFWKRYYYYYDYYYYYYYYYHKVLPTSCTYMWWYVGFYVCVCKVLSRGKEWYVLYVFRVS